MIKILLTTIVLLSVLFANAEEITLDWLKDKPRTYAKDFYIWQYLKQDITPDEAIIALGQANNVNNKLFYSYARKLKHDETTAVMQCMRAKIKNLINTNADCLEVGLSVYQITKLNSNQLEKVQSTLGKKYPKKTKILNIVGASIPFTKLISTDNETFFALFNNCGSAFRNKKFNYKLPKNTIKRLSKDKKFNQTIKLIVTNNNLKQLQKSLLNIDDTNLSHRSSFLLAINAIRHKKEENAAEYLEKAYAKAYYQFDKDKVTFWKYLTTNHTKHLYNLTQSWDVNIYTLYANEFFENKNKNIVYDIANNDNLVYEYKDVSNPFFWIPILNNLKNLNENKISGFKADLNSQETSPHLSFILERYYNYRKSYFITPYKKYLSNYSQDRQSLINAIARQESRFITSSISTAYAMGVMQIMPFLSKAISKQLGEDYEITDQLKPETNLRYASYHLNFLENSLKHPLLIAYAYNGGIGFTRRMLKNGLFNKNSNYKEYEPFMSMELLPYDETKKYGKKVLANYYVYKNYLDKENPIKIKELFDMLKY
jgi:soluble lytic murein transglycosylase